MFYFSSACRRRFWNVTTASSTYRKASLMGSRIGTGYFIYLHEVQPLAVPVRFHETQPCPIFPDLSYVEVLSACATLVKHSTGAI